MTPAHSSEKIDQLIHRLHTEQEHVREAIRRDDIPAANRHLMKAWRAIKDVGASGPRGRDAIERLLASPLADIRLRAAEAAINWAPDLAVPVFGRLLVENLGEQVSADERLEIRIAAKLMLYKHFGVRSYDQNDLIEPLRSYGVDLPYFDHEKWQRGEIPTLPNRKKSGSGRHE